MKKINQELIALFDKYGSDRRRALRENKKLSYLYALADHLVKVKGNPKNNQRFFSTNSTDIMPSFYCLIRYSTAAVTYSRTVFYTTGFIDIVLFASLYDILSGNAKPFYHIHTNFLYFSLFPA